MEAANLKKRMVRLSTKFHRRMTGDERLNNISGYIDSIESTIDSILRDFLVSSNAPVAPVQPEEVVAPPEKPSRKETCSEEEDST